MGKSPKKIKVTVSNMDAFSDEIKVGGLIDEIEMAEAKARAALLERQIKESQPSRLSLRIKRLGNSVKNVATGLKTSIKSITIKPVRTPRSLSAPRTSLISRINEMAPNGIPLKNTLAICISAAAIVAGGELGIWALTHPATQAEVPKTGFVIDDTADTDTTIETHAATGNTPKPTDTNQDSQAETEAQANTTYRVQNYTSTQKKATAKPASANTSHSTYVDSNLTDGEMVVEVADPDAEPKDAIIYYEPAEKEETESEPTEEQDAGEQQDEE